MYNRDIPLAGVLAITLRAHLFSLFVGVLEFLQ